MWKYKCRSQLLSLILAFVAGFAMTFFLNSDEMFLEMMEGTLPNEVMSIFVSNPWIIGVSSGIGFMGLLNVFLLISLISVANTGLLLMFALIAIMMPDYAIMIGVLAIPVTLVLNIYGWVSLRMTEKKNLAKANIKGDDDIVRAFLEHHQLDPEYEAIANEAKASVKKINFALVLGLIAEFCALFFFQNLIISMILVFFCVMGIQYLQRIRAASLNNISAILINECNPEGCLSALIYFGKKGNHYKLKNRALCAQCLIYLNEPELAQQVLIEFPKSNVTNVMAYDSLMGYIYYMLKDEEGLNRVKNEMESVRAGTGSMMMMIKTEELGAIQNRISLMKGDFNTCKKYYLNLLKRSVSNLQRSDCSYYIALISFVQEDYVVAKMYFEKVLQTGNKLYFVNNAKNYLSKIENSPLLEHQQEEMNQPMNNQMF